jgi:hypothetical protein
MRDHLGPKYWGANCDHRWVLIKTFPVEEPRSFKKHSFVTSLVFHVKHTLALFSMYHQVHGSLVDGPEVLHKLRCTLLPNSTTIDG